MRPPKASHCGQCGHCVQGWDHHCIALNNCVGTRNIRGFVTFLLVSFLFAASVSISSLCVLFTKRDYSERSKQKMICVGFGIFVAILTFAATIRPRCKNNCRFLTGITGMTIALGLTLVLCRDAASIVAGSFIYIGLGYDLIIREMLFDYLSMVTRHTTVKELAARSQALKEKCINKDNDYKKQSVPSKLKCKRLFNFFFCKEIPKSYITGADILPKNVTVVYQNKKKANAVGVSSDKDLIV